MSKFELENASSILNDFQVYLLHGKEKGLTKQMIEKEQEKVVKRLEDSMNSYMGIELANCFLKKGKLSPAELKERMADSIGEDLKMIDPQEHLEAFFQAKESVNPDEPDALDHACAETFAKTFLSNMPYDVYENMYHYLNMVEEERGR